MLGLGKWKFTVNTMFFRGDTVLSVKEKDGEYDISIDIPGMQTPEFSFGDLKTEGNTVTGVARVNMMGLQNVNFSFTFEEDSANGMLKVPYMGKIALKNGVRID